MSLFKQFIQLRDKLAENLNDSVDLLNAVSSDDIVNIAKSVPITDDRTLSFSINGEDNKVLSIFDKDGNISSSIQVTEFNKLQEYADDNQTWGQILDDVSEGTNVYQVLSELTSKFSYSSRIRFSDLSSYLNELSGASLTSLRNALFAATDNDGYITRYGFVGALQSMMHLANESASNNTYELDRSNPYTVDAIMRVVIQGVGLSISAICVILSNTFGAILAIIGFIIGAICNLLSNFIDTGYMKADPSCGNLYVNGPVIASDNVSSDYVWHSASITGKHVWLSESNGVGIFIWPYDWDHTNSFKINGYLYPCWDAYNLVKYLYGLGNISLTGTGNTIVKFTNSSVIANAFTNPSFQYLKNDDSAILTEGEIAASLLIDHVVQSISAVETVQSASLTDFIWRTDGQYGTGKDEVLMYHCALMIRHIIESSSKAEFLAGNANYAKNGMDALANWIKDEVFPYRDNINGRPANDNYPFVMSTGANQNFPMLYNILGGNRALCTYSTVYHHMILRLNGDIYNYDKLCYPDCLPTEWGITLPRVDLTQLTAALIGISAAVTAIAVAGNAIKKAITKKMILKQTLRANDINKKRADFLANPSNNQLKEDYLNSVYKYNKLGKWFGWGSYDVANGWVNTPSSIDYGSIDHSTISLQTDYNLLQAIKQLIKAE